MGSVIMLFTNLISVIGIGIVISLNLFLFPGLKPLRGYHTLGKFSVELYQTMISDGVVLLFSWFSDLSIIF